MGKPSGERAVEWWEGFLPAVIGVSTFGGSITFSVIVSEIADPGRLNPSNQNAVTYTRFQRETVRMFLALSWLLFIMALGVASMVAQLLSFHRERFRDNFEKPMSGMPILNMITNGGGLHGLSLLLNGLMLGAFYFLSLAVVAYVETVGWIAVAFTSTYVLIVGGVWVAHAVRQ
ncbi:hypothetical protein FGG08_005685 [Glutinoglossum americanum]|uniref:Uncharacterized protein n=1 Tax=Glutinoglossum americanum TaxID=1670608 RepID=A0A9P8HZU0_9PEZI|nr:hypothetical protein FGG08_005685 [Glutinoglossum americanum]